DDLLDRYLVIGTPATCVRQIQRLQREVGITHFNCSFWFGDLEQARVLRSMELFAREVMPAFACAGGAGDEQSGLRSRVARRLARAGAVLGLPGRGQL